MLALQKVTEKDDIDFEAVFNMVLSLSSKFQGLKNQKLVSDKEMERCINDLWQLQFSLKYVNTTLRQAKLKHSTQMTIHGCNQS